MNFKGNSRYEYISYDLTILLNINRGNNEISLHNFSALKTYDEFEQLVTIINLKETELEILVQQKQYILCFIGNY
jgi:hypothetical protein